MRTRANNSVTRTNGSCILWEGCTEGWTTFAAVAARTRALSIYLARIVVQADGRGCQRGTIIGRHGQCSQADITPIRLGRYDTLGASHQFISTIASKTIATFLEERSFPMIVRFRRFIVRYFFSNHEETRSNSTDASTVSTSIKKVFQRNRKSTE